jgi:hypothetical protein
MTFFPGSGAMRTSALPSATSVGLESALKPFKARDIERGPIDVEFDLLSFAIFDAFLWPEIKHTIFKIDRS